MILLTSPVEKLLLKLIGIFAGTVNQFAAPEWLLLLFLIPLYLLFYLYYLPKKRLYLKVSFNPEKLFPQKRTPLTWLRHLPLTFQCLALLFMILAMARPQHTNTQQQQKEGISIMMALDVSRSMGFNDFYPNRMEIVKEKAIEFILGRQNDKIGLTLFGQDALSYAPLTLDYQALIEQIKIIRTRMLGDATNIGNALGISINRLSQSNSPSKVIILLTDGAHIVPPSYNKTIILPIDAAKSAAKKGIKVYCIGIGRPEAADVDEALLQKIAKLTGGKFFRSSNETGLSNIFKDISNMETTKIEDNAKLIAVDAYTPLLTVALINLFLAFSLMAISLYNPLEG